MKFRVYGQFTVSGCVEVDVADDADDPEQEAMDLAYDRFGKPTTYAGNGSISGLVGFGGHGIGTNVTELEIEAAEPIGDDDVS